MTSDRRMYLVHARSFIVKHLREFTAADGYPRDEFDQLVRTLELLDVVLGNGPSITCPYCGWTSYHPGDIENRWCGNCNDAHDTIALRKRVSDGQ
jgi:hypothetical protein